MRLPTNFSLPLAALLFGLLLVPQAAMAQSWNAAANFEKGWIAQTNPNGVWSYGYSSGFTNPITLYDQTVQNGVNGPNAQYWLSPSVDIGTSPSAEYNDGPAYNDGNVDFLANEFVLVPGIGGQYSDLVFTAPANGEYSVVGSFRGAQYGVDTVVAVVANGKNVFKSNVTAVGQTVPFDTEVFLTAGKTVVFSVGPRSNFQNTGLSATITTLPCTLKDTASYNATSSTLTMKFTIGNKEGTTATWNAWLTYQNTMTHLFSVAQPITSPPVAITKTTSLPKKGKVGVLSTLTIPTKGIVCSSWVKIATGTP